jgi:hypothetical protein
LNEPPKPARSDYLRIVQWLFLPVGAIYGWVVYFAAGWVVSNGSIFPQSNAQGLAPLYRLARIVSDAGPLPNIIFGLAFGWVMALALEAIEIRYES